MSSQKRNHLSHLTINMICYSKLMILLILTTTGIAGTPIPIDNMRNLPPVSSTEMQMLGPRSDANVNSFGSGEIELKHRTNFEQNSLLGGRIPPSEGMWLTNAEDIVISEFKVNENAGRADHWQTEIAYFSDGSYVVVWHEYRNVHADVFAQIFSSTGVAQGTNFLVNDDEGASQQEMPDVDTDVNGNFIITWNDARNGNWDVYGQRYDSGAGTQGSNFLVNDDGGLSDQRRPKIAIQSTGDFVVSWHDYRNGDADIYAKQYDINGIESGSGFKVNDDGGTSNQFEPDIAVDGNDNFLITWRDDRNGNPDVYARQYDGNGEARGVSFQVSEGAESVSEETPSIATDGNGNYVIAWADGRNGQTDIYARLYDENARQALQYDGIDDFVEVGSASALNFENTNPFTIECWVTVSSAQSGYGTIISKFDATSDNKGWGLQLYNGVLRSFVGNNGEGQSAKIKGVTDLRDDIPHHIVWSYDGSLGGAGLSFWIDGQSESTIIYSDDLSTSLISNIDPVEIGGNTGWGEYFLGDISELRIWNMVRSESEINDNMNVSLIGTETGLVGYWKCDEATGATVIDASSNSNNGTLYGPVWSVSTTPSFLVNDDGTSYNKAIPKIDMNTDGFIVSWCDARNAQWEVFLQRYNSIGEIQGSNMMVNDMDPVAGNWDNSIALHSDGNYVLAWADSRHGNFDIQAQQYNGSGIAQGPNIRVNDDVGSSHEQLPSIASDGSGNFIVTWIDSRNGDRADVYAQRYDANGVAQGSSIHVNDDTGYKRRTKYWTRIAANSKGDFIITWRDGRNNSNNDIFAQRYDNNGVAQGPNILVNDDGGTNTHSTPDAAIDNAGNIVVSWYDNRNGNFDIFAQKYDATGVAQGGNFLISDDGGSSDQYLTTITMDPEGNFVIAWYDERHTDGSTGDIYARRYDNIGLPLGSSFPVNDEYGNNDHYWPQIAGASNGDFVICWHDVRNGNWDIYAQKYNNAGIAQGANFIANDVSETEIQSYPSIAVDDDGSFFIAWLDFTSAVQIVGRAFYNDGTPVDNSFAIHQNPGLTTVDDPSVTLYDGTVYASWESDPVSGLGLDIFAYGTQIDELKTSISSIQYTDQIGSDENDCYASPLNGTTHTISGYVTATNSWPHGDGTKFYLQDGSNPWDGIYVYNSPASVFPAMGDYLTVTGTVWEYYGVTELKDITSYKIHSPQNPLPEPLSITTGALSVACDLGTEQYEGNLVKLSNLTVVGARDSIGQWWVDDGSGVCEIDNNFFNYEPKVGQYLESITGVLNWSWGAWEVNPRIYEDLVGAAVNVTFKVDMTQETVDPSGVFLAGGGTFGVPGDYPLYDDGTNGDEVAGDNIYTIIVPILENTGTDYTFSNGDNPDFSGKEFIGGQVCAEPPWDDRHIEVGVNDITVFITFGQCPENELSNGGFEMADSQDDAVGWGVDHASVGAHAIITMDPADAHTDDNFAEIGIENGAAWAVFYTEDYIPASQGDILELGGYIKDISANPTGGAFGGLKIEAKDVVGTVLQTTGDIFFDITTAYELYSTQMIMPEGTVQATAVLVANRQDGANVNYAFDDIYFGKAYSAEPEMTDHTITFLADMTQLLLDGFNPQSQSIELRGGFNSWVAGDVLAPDPGDPNLYTITIEISGNVGDVIEWKFKANPDIDFNNNGWEREYLGNRTFHLPPEDALIGPIQPDIHFMPMITEGWNHQEDFQIGPNPHGLVVDPSGRIWAGYYNYPDTLGLPSDTIPIIPIYVFNPDGSQASFSPIRFLTVDGVTDTMLNACRGMTLDQNGNVLYSTHDNLYRINYQTGEGMNKVTPSEGSPLTEAAVDGQGNIYIGHVVPNGKPGYIYHEDFTYYGNFADNTYQIGRSMVITPDGKDIYWGEIYGDNNGLLHYHSDNGVSGPWILVETLYGATVASGEPRLWPQSLDWDNNGLLWVGTYWGAETYSYRGWYALDPTQNFAIVDSVGRMSVPGTGSMGDNIAPVDIIYAPRGAAWSADGLTMYTADFDGNIIKRWYDPDPILPLGMAQHALQFDGTDDYVKADGVPIPSDDLTIEAWIHPTALTTLQEIVFFHDDTSSVQFRMESSGALTYGEVNSLGWNSVTSPDNMILSNSWNHVAVSKQAGRTTLYVNGIQAGFNQINNNIIPNTLSIGARSINPDRIFAGNIDEVRIWTVARSQSEIQANMTNYLDGTETGLYVYYRMDTGLGQTVFDLSGNGHDGQFGSTQGTDVNDPVWIVSEWPYEIPLNANYSADVTAGNLPLTVQFTDHSTGNLISWAWDFNSDGTIDSYDQNPEWTFSDFGFYTVTLTVNDGSDTSTEIKSDYITVYQYVVHDNNNTLFTVFNNGVLGKERGGIGEGFQFNGANGLYEGDLLVAQSANQVSGVLYSRRDYRILDSVEPISSPLSGFDQAYETRFDDQRAVNPIGVEIRQRTHSKSTSPDDDFVIVDYDVLNNSGSDLTGIYIGLAMDWDVGTYSNNLGGYDAQRKLNYIYEVEEGQSNSNYYGMTALSGDISGQLVWSWMDESIADEGSPAFLFESMTSIGGVYSDTTDLRAILATGPYDIAAGSSVRAAYAILAGTDLIDLQANADVAHGVFTADEVITTNEWVSFYGLNSTINGLPFPEGTVVRAYDPDAVLCGISTTTNQGAYGVMPVYRDDATTTDVDEGANPGDAITFTVNHFNVSESGTWTTNGAVLALEIHVVVPDIATSTASLDFGPIMVGSEAQMDVVIKNVGGADLVVGDIEWSDGGGVVSRDPVFSIADTSGTIAAGDSMTVAVSFKPFRGSGAINDALLVRSDDPDTPTKVIAVTGVIATDVVPTNEWVSFWGTNSTLDDEALQVGDVVDAYDPNGVHCGVYTVTNPGAYGMMAVYRDDATTSDIDEGADPGDAITFRINGFMASPMGPDDRFWSVNGDVKQVDLQAYPISSLEISLNAGWNLISWNMDTENDSTRNILAGIMDNLVVALGFDGGGLTFDPNLPDFINSLNVMDHMHGYWLKLSAPDTLQLAGAFIDPQTQYFLGEGWNLISYLPVATDSTRHALSQIMDNLTVVLGFDEGGLAFDPGLPDFINSLTYMSPSFGYWVKLTGQDTLVYPSTPAPQPMMVSNVDMIDIGYSEVQPTNEWINLYAENMVVDEEALAIGTVIKAEDPAGVICGEYIVSQPGVFGLMPVYRDDPTTIDIDEGALPGDQITIYFNDFRVPVAIEWTENGAIVDFEGMVNALGVDLLHLPKTFNLSQNYPNPFNPLTSIKYQLPQATDVSLKIYNIMGQEVKTLVSQHQEPGYYQVTWDGTLRDGQPVASGLYIYQLRAGSFMKTHKMMFLK